MSSPAQPNGESAPAAYVLGHSDRELRRLAAQAVLIEPITRGLLLDAGLAPGMRVLDIGTGRGDVAFLASELVGETGAVVGVDRAPEAVAAARSRLETHVPHNVSFEEGDPSELEYGEPFDALIGRYVLQFQPDPAVLLRRLAALLRPGAIVAFHEIDWSNRRSVPPVELWDRLCALVVETVAAGGAETQSGSKVPSVFAAAGLPAPTIRMTTVVGAGANSRDVVGRLAAIVRTLLPSMEERGLVAPGEIDADALEDVLLQEIAATSSFVASTSDLTAWCRV
jgi:SAM-dependent methyltransferase